MLLEECEELRAGPLPAGLPVGQAVATGAGQLAASHVIHTVGPNRHAGQTNPALLRSCFTESLRIAEELGARTVALPAVSAGVYGWDIDEVARIAVDAARSHRGRSVEIVRFVLFGAPALQAFERALAVES